VRRGPALRVDRAGGRASDQAQTPMLSVEAEGPACVFTIGDHRLELSQTQARQLGAYLDARAAEKVWEEADAVEVGAWRFEAARDARWQKPGDIGRRRVRIYSPAGNWHFLPEELVRLGEMFRQAAP